MVQIVAELNAAQEVRRGADSRPAVEQLVLAAPCVQPDGAVAVLCKLIAHAVDRKVVPAHFALPDGTALIGCRPLQNGCVIHAGEDPVRKHKLTALHRQRTVCLCRIGKRDGVARQRCARIHLHAVVRAPACQIEPVAAA